MSRNAMLLVDALRDPATTRALDSRGWTALIAMARAEQLIGTLAHRLSDEDVPQRVAAILADARINADYQRRSALWEAECAARALADYPGKVVLMKGTAYVAAGLKAGEGRHIGDLDIMVAREDLPEVERLLIEKGGWEWVKEDAYDDAYYRDHMHELPPLIHKDRDRMIDVHHTILPLTARPRPDAADMLREAFAILSVPNPIVSSEVETPRDRAQTDGPLDFARGERNLGLNVLAPHDRIIHCAAHLIADGDLAGGLRNLWDMHCLLGETDDWAGLKKRGERHELWPAVNRATCLAHHLYGTEIPNNWHSNTIADNLYIRRLIARDGWGCTTRKFTRLAFYIRSHWLRMPPLMLARHLWTKWRKQKR